MRGPLNDILYILIFLSFAWNEKQILSDFDEKQLIKK